jgi:hypothetical protein
MDPAVIEDSLQRHDQKWIMKACYSCFHNHEPYYASYTKEDFGTLALACGLVQVRSVMAFVSKIMVFTKA